jgi:hypothetical protein
MNQHQLACNVFNEALAHLGHAPVYQAYRQVIVMRLASSQVELNDMSSAETNLGHVVRARIKIFGYSNPGTWAPIQALCDLLKKRGQTREASLVFRKHNQAYHREQDRQWYRDNGESVPPDLQDSPNPSEDAWPAAVAGQMPGHLLAARI